MLQTSERLFLEIASGQRSLDNLMVFERLFFDLNVVVCIFYDLSRSIGIILWPSWILLFSICEMQPKVNFQERNSIKTRSPKSPIFLFRDILLAPREMNGLLLTKCQVYGTSPSFLSLLYRDLVFHT